MTLPDAAAAEPVPAALPGRLPLPWLVALCLGSGCAALIYEVVWFQVLELVIGSSAISLGLLLGTFMGGLCVGSLVLPDLALARNRPLTTWIVLQVGLGGMAIAILNGLPWTAGLYASHAPPGAGGIVLRGTFCTIFLGPPTVLMGATLPVISRCVPVGDRRPANLGLLYAGNTFGAVLGCLLAGFYLLPAHDTAVATFVALSLNAILALAPFALRHSSNTSPPDAGSLPDFVQPGVTRHWALLAIAISGACALGAEVVWTRLLSLIFGATVYAFSIILAVYLSGLAIGGIVGASLARRQGDAARLLGFCQIALAGAVAWAAWIINRSLPYWPVNPSLAGSVWVSLQLDLLRCLWAIFPATCLWGASFPLALAAVPGRREDSARLVGRVYAANTAGAIVGALSCSLGLIAWLGTQNIQRLLVMLSLAAGTMLLLASARLRSDQHSRPDGWTIMFSLRAPQIMALGLVLAVVSVWSIPRLPWGLVAYGRNLPQKSDLGMRLYVGEGLNASVAVSQAPTGQRLFHVSGKVEASTDPQDMRLQEMLAHLPALLHPDPRSVLVVGCGAGVTAGSFVLHPSVERVTICEIEPLIPAQVTPFFEAQNNQVLRDPRVSLVFDDARHYILRTREHFDIITSDPIHPWIKGAATLYTKEYFQFCKDHLNPGGLVTQWVPLYESSLEAVKVEIATFFEVFPNGTLWSNDELSGGGYDMVLLGQADTLRIDLDELQKRWHRPDHAQVAQALGAVGLSSAFSLLTTYAGQGPDLAPLLRGAPINRDANLRLQYLAGQPYGSWSPSGIYTELLRYRKYPEETIAASSVWARALRQNFERLPAKP